jgi:S-methylmethionine-dependent homocysteine/selenocysteine methylase
MVNCAHPTHFADALATDGSWRRRLRRPAGERIHEKPRRFDEATELDEGDPVDLGARHAALRDRLSTVTVLGGCCGTDARHVVAIILAWRAD